MQGRLWDEARIAVRTSKPSQGYVFFNDLCHIPRIARNCVANYNPSCTRFTHVSNERNIIIMKRLSMLAFFICSLVYHSNCAAAAKVVSYPITRALPNYAQTSVASLSRRANTDEILTNNISLGAYYASVQVGTPAQTLTLLLGTGSSDVWVVDKLAATCSSSNCLTPCQYYN